MREPIIFICPHKKMCDEVLSVSEELREDVEVIQGWYPEVLDFNIMKKYKEIRAVVALPITCKIVAKKIKTTGFPLNPTSLDLMEAFSEARTYADEISYVGFFFPALQELPRIEKLLGIRINVFSYTQPEHMIDRVRDALQQKRKIVVVTGDKGKRAVEKFGGIGIIVQVSRFSISEVLRITQQVLASREQEAARRQWLERLINLSSDGIIATDSSGRITLFNKSAEKYLSVPSRVAEGLSIDAMDSNDPLKIVIRGQGGGSFIAEEVISLKGKHLLVQRALVSGSTADEQLIVSFKNESEVEKLKQAVHRDAIRKGMVATYTFDDIVGKSKAIRALKEEALVYAETASTVLLTGETGAGKEVFAHSIHNASDRSKKPFVGVNCATIPENLLESELFGYEGGSFTGARKEGKRGLFEYADGGTIFLDEIGEMSHSLQARLLRVLQDKKEIRRVGGERTILVDVRVIAATNRDLLEEVAVKRFREDLYYRLNILSLRVPPLRERKEDIEDLILHFLKAKAQKFLSPPPPITDELIQLFKEYDWPGNIRQLENIVERCFVISRAKHFTSLVKQLLVSKQEKGQSREKMINQASSNSMLIEIDTIANIEKQIIRALLPHYGIKELSKKLGISRTTIWRRASSDCSINEHLER